jgi:diguanylate cyclase (GGDEF)-like protein/PAS domain S-box-containing protein
MLTLFRRQVDTWPWRSTVIVVAFNALFIAWIALKPGSPAEFVAIDNVAQFMGPLFMALLYLRARRKNTCGAAPHLRTAQRWVPLLLAVGALSEAGGQIVYTIYGQVLHYTSVPLPSWADAIYLWSYPFLLLAIMLLPGRRLHVTSRMRVLLDGLMVMATVVTFSWYFILGPTIAESGGTLVATVVGLAYPLGDIVLIVCLLMLGSRLDEPDLRPIVILLSGALGIVVLTDTIYDYQNLHGGYTTGGLLDVGWPLGYMLVMLSGLALRTVLAKRRIPIAAALDLPLPVVAVAHPTGPPSLWSSLLPSTLIPAVGLLLLYTRVVGKRGQYDMGVSVGALALVVVVVLRQVLTILENRRLYTRLDEAYAAQGQTLAQREHQMHTVVANAPIVLWAVDRDGICTLYEGQALATLGHESGQYVGLSTFETWRAQPRVLEAIRRALSGETSTLVVAHGDLTYETSWTPVCDDAGAVTGAIGVSHDITERTRAEAALEHQAFHDALTGLPNRVLFMDRLTHALTRAARQGGTVGVLFLDLDRFKLINDSLGHGAGDALLVAVAARLQDCVRVEDTVARFGGDEFAILLADLDDVDATLRAAERIIQDLDAPFRLDGHDVVTAASIGISTGAPVHTAADVLRDADAALYRAKAKGRGRYEVFDETMNAKALERLELEADMRAALERGEFLVYYQPKVALDSGRVEGMEALVRWQHPTRGLISPVAFVPLAEETGLIRPLGQWVLEEACRQTRRWCEQAPDLGLVTSVNLSARQFQQPTLVEDVERALRVSGVSPKAIQLEITESVAMEDAETTIETLYRLKGLGVQLAIDDFGTGYSSLAYLKRFPVDALKIDRAFVSGIQVNGEDASIVNAVASLGHALNLSVVAEGIETAEESRHVHALGCEVGQGYYFAKPLAAADADAFVIESITHAA